MVPFKKHEKGQSSRQAVEEGAHSASKSIEVPYDTYRYFPSMLVLILK